MKRFASLIQETPSYLKRLARRWKLVTIRKLLYLPHILSGQEKRLFLLLGLCVAVGGWGLGWRIYTGITHEIPAVGGSYTEGILGNPHAINPLYASDDPDRDIARLVFSGLLTYNGKGEIEADLANHYEVSTDGKTYTVFLKKNLAWQDGKPLNSDDVVFTIRTIQNPSYKSPFRPNWQGVDVQKLDAQTIRFTLRSPYAPFIENLTQGIIPRHLWQNISPEQAILHELNIKPVGSGPYRPGGFRLNGDGTLAWYELTRNWRYYRGGPYVSKITFRFFGNEDAMIASWRKGDVDGFGPVSANHISELPRQNISLLYLQMPRIFSLFFNSQQAPALKNLKVRQALALAINKERLAASSTFGGGTIINQLLPYTHLAIAGNVTAYSYNPDAARKLLDSAGWKTGPDGIRRKQTKDKGKTGTEEFHLALATSDWPELVRAAETIKTMFRDVGLDVTIQQKTISELEASAIRPRNFQMLLFGQVYGYEPDPFAFWHSSQIKDPGLNVALYANKKTDQILEDARRTSDPSVRAQKYKSFVEIASGDIPAIPLYTQLYLYVLPPDMQGVSLSEISLPADRFNDIHSWYRRIRRVFF